jgi:hypothetical protein
MMRRVNTCLDFTWFLAAMSRLTAAQVVKLGEYLNPDFDPNTLTVNQLLGIFGFHNVQYPTPYTKPKLVALFKDEITAKSNKLNRERVKRANSVASDDGITNGHTGRPLNDKVGQRIAWGWDLER